FESFLDFQAIRCCRFATYGDAAQTGRRLIALERVRQRDQALEDPRLRRRKSLSIEQSIVQPPGDLRDLILKGDVFDPELRLLQFLDELVFLVTPLMSDPAIERPIQIFSRRHEHDDPSARLQQLIGAAERSDIVRRMLENIDAEDGVESIAR